MINEILEASKSDVHLAGFLDEARECAHIYLLAKQIYKGFGKMEELLILEGELKDAVEKMIRYCKEKSYLSGPCTCGIDSMADALVRINGG